MLESASYLSFGLQRVYCNWWNFAAEQKVWIPSMHLLSIAFSHFIFVLLCVHVQIIHVLFWNIFIFRSAVVWSWWISLPRSCDLCLPELAVWWGPWLPWWFRRVFRYLWVERFSCHSYFSYMWNEMSVFTDDCCCSWFTFSPQIA